VTERDPDDIPVEGDDTEVVEEGDHVEAGADEPIQGDPTEFLPLEDPGSEEGLNLSDDS